MPWAATQDIHLGTLGTIELQRWMLEAHNPER